jgi:acyl-CoA oxidase
LVISLSLSLFSLLLLLLLLFLRLSCIPPSGPLNAVLKDVCDLFALYHMQQNAGEFVESGYLTGEHLGMLRQQIRALLGKLRVNAVSLVDAMNFSDRELGSALGRYDGRVYETLYEWAQQEPLNRADVSADLRALLRAKL